MFRSIATISFICLSAGSLAAAKAPNQNTIENVKINRALTALLEERESYGSRPSQSTAGNGVAETRLALERYLARRDSWGAGPQPAAAGNPHSAALAAYLVRRERWGSSPSTSTVDTRTALAAYLARRDSWGSAPTRITGNPHGEALAAYLARRDSWGSVPTAIAGNRNAQALAAYFARRDSWGTKPAAKPDAIASALDSLLRERASWGTRPSITSAETNQQPGLTLAAYLERRARWNEAGATRVAAFAMTRPAQQEPSDCAATLHQITSSGAINFASDSALLTDEVGGKLKQVAAAGRDCTGFRIRIKGHTDATGDAAMNQALSEQRASAVADYLQAAGIDADALEAIGFGESQPLVPNTTRANRAQNRRIELNVLIN